MEEGGFVTHPMLAWLYGTGFPKGANLSREFDRTRRQPKPTDAFRIYLRAAIKRSDYTQSDLDQLCGTNGMIGHYVGKSQPQYPSLENWKILKRALRLDDEYDHIIEDIDNDRRRVEAAAENERDFHLSGLRREFAAYVPETQLAKKWTGYRHGLQILKPAIEPIYMGQKNWQRPMTENVKRWGVGALNVAATYHQSEDGVSRYPVNVVTDGSQVVKERLERQSAGSSKLFAAFPNEAPFIYVAKPSATERGSGNNHPTVKPIVLMEHLVRLVTPEGGVCLDPFMGSGTTGVACKRTGHQFIGIEKMRAYYAIAEKRIAKATPAREEAA